MTKASYSYKVTPTTVGGTIMEILMGEMAVSTSNSWQSYPQPPHVGGKVVTKYLPSGEKKVETHACPECGAMHRRKT